MTEYRFRHSRGYNFYVRYGGKTISVAENFLRNHILPFEEENPTTRIHWKRFRFFADFKIQMLRACATEETTMFDNFHVDSMGAEIFARKEPKPVLWRCLNPKCKGYEWKSSPRHTMGCPKCKKDNIELVKNGIHNKPTNRTVGRAISTTKQRESDNSCQQSLF